MESEIQAQINSLGITDITPEEYEQIKKYVNQQSLSDIKGLPPSAPVQQNQVSGRPVSAMTSIDFLEQKRKENDVQKDAILDLYTKEDNQSQNSLLQNLQNHTQKSESATIQQKMEQLLDDFMEPSPATQKDKLKPEISSPEMDQTVNVMSGGEDYQDDCLEDYYCFMDKKRDHNNQQNQYQGQHNDKYQPTIQEYTGSSNYDTFNKPSGSATISKFMPKTKSTMKEKQKRKSDPVNNYLAYQSRWNIQGAPQERKQRIQKSKVDDIVGEFLLRNNGLRQ